MKDTFEPIRDEDNIPAIQVNELSFQEDTIYAYRDQLLTFSFSTRGEEEIVGVVLLLDSSEYQVIEESVGSVGFSHEFLSHGPHQVDL